jgi:hypothetical protein
MVEGRPPYSHLQPFRAMMQIPLKPPPTFKDPSTFSDECNVY